MGERDPKGLEGSGMRRYHVSRVSLFLSSSAIATDTSILTGYEDRPLNSARRHPAGTIKYAPCSYAPVSSCYNRQASVPHCRMSSASSPPLPLLPSTSLAPPILFPGSILSDHDVFYDVNIGSHPTGCTTPLTTLPYFPRNPTILVQIVMFSMGADLKVTGTRTLNTPTPKTKPIVYSTPLEHRLLLSPRILPPSPLPLPPPPPPHHHHHHPALPPPTYFSSLLSYLLLLCLSLSLFSSSLAPSPLASAISHAQGFHSDFLLPVLLARS